MAVLQSIGDAKKMTKEVWGDNHTMELETCLEDRGRYSGGGVG